MAKAKSKAKPAAKAKAKPQAKAAKPAKKAALKTKAAQPAPKALSKSAAKTASKSAAKPAPKSTAKPATAAAPKVAATKSGDLLKTFTPLDDRLLIERTGVADRTPGGLYIPETVSSSDRPTQGRVVAVGRGHRDKKGRLRPLDVQLGDTVMFTSYAGSEVKIGDRELTLLREQDLIAIVK